MHLTLTIPAEPIAQGRPRFSSRGGFVRAYDPKKSKDWKAFIADFASRCMEEQGYDKPTDVPLKVRARFAFSLPKSRWRKRSPVEAQWRSQKPDLDNLFKAVTDACEGIVYHNDSQIVKVVIEKIMVAQGEAPYVAVVFESAGELNGA
mgnify:FL=1|jgi:Holliday junction resolvase RusA-like endonuclease|tara:strand:+ start:13127 stop:13570 length:444 start_codon:yes stop_codon:yes gene_type:complete